MSQNDARRCAGVNRLFHAESRSLFPVTLHVQFDKHGFVKRPLVFSVVVGPQDDVQSVFDRCPNGGTVLFDYGCFSQKKYSDGPLRITKNLALFGFLIDSASTIFLSPIRVTARCVSFDHFRFERPVVVESCHTFTVLDCEFVVIKPGVLRILDGDSVHVHRTYFQVSSNIYKFNKMKPFIHTKTVRTVNVYDSTAKCVNSALNIFDDIWLKIHGLLHTELTRPSSALSYLDGTISSEA